MATPAEELLVKVVNNETLKTWELEHLYSKLTREHDKQIIANLVARLLMGEDW